MNLKRVVVTGLGAITPPLGNTVEELWDSLINGGVSGAAGITRFDASKFKTQIACEIKGYDPPANYFDRKESRKIDPYTQYAMIAADQAIADANFNMDTLDKDRVGVIIATGIGGFTSFLQEVIEFAKGDGTPRFNPFFLFQKLLEILPQGIFLLNMVFVDLIMLLHQLAPLQVMQLLMHSTKSN